MSSHFGHLLHRFPATDVNISKISHAIGWASYLRVVINIDVTYLKQHFQRRYASTELQCIEPLALEIMKEYAIWLGMTQVITSQREINN